MTPGSLFISEQEAADRLGVCRKTIMAAIERGEIPGVARVGRSVRIFWPAVVLRYLDVDVGLLAKQLRIRSLDELVAFLAGVDSYPDVAQRSESHARSETLSSHAQNQGRA